MSFLMDNTLGRGGIFFGKIKRLVQKKKEKKSPGSGSSGKEMKNVDCPFFVIHWGKTVIQKGQNETGPS